MPNAQERLKECENSFKKSYGENLERVMALKGNSSNEAVLYVRTHHMFSRILKLRILNFKFVIVGEKVGFFGQK